MCYTLFSCENIMIREFVAVFFLTWVISYVFIKRKKSCIFNIKYLSNFLAGVFVLRYLTIQDKILISITESGLFLSNSVIVIILLLTWFSYMSTIILILYPFFKFDILKNFIKYFCFPCVVLNFAMMNEMILAVSGKNNLDVYSVLYSLECSIELFLCCYVILNEKTSKIEWKKSFEAVLTFLIFLVVAIPPYVPNALFVNIGVFLVKDFMLYHRIFLYIGVVFLLIIFYMLKDKNQQYKKMVLLYISLVTLISFCYNYSFETFLKPTSWPLHLCNTAMFIIPICIIFKFDKLFYFTLFINVIGAFLACLMPNYAETLGFFSTSVVKFWINHIIAFSIPILMVLLKIYQRPKLKEYFYSLIGLFIYFFIIIFVNAWLFNYDKGVDFFFLNSDFVAEKLGRWAENLRDIKVSFSLNNLTFVLFPVYQLFYLIGFVLLSFVMWFIFEIMFKTQDFYSYVNIENKKINLERLELKIKCETKTDEKEKKMNEDGKLIIKNLYKKYGISKNYAVEDVSMEVSSGEIIGFLGPNGAGKSTIIKCIVGIHEPTSGEIKINGYDMSKQPIMAKKNLGFVPDHYALYEKLTGREYLNFISDLYSVEKKIRDEKIEELSKKLNIDTVLDNFINTYSHGMKQKIAIMSALVHNPKVWILDEPLTGLDPDSIYQVKECMLEHARQGNIVFFSSHIIDIVEKLCDRVIIILGGKIQGSVCMNDLKKKNMNLERYYLVKVDAEKKYHGEKNE